MLVVPVARKVVVIILQPHVGSRITERTECHRRRQTQAFVQTKFLDAFDIAEAQSEVETLRSGQHQRTTHPKLVEIAMFGVLFFVMLLFLIVMLSFLTVMMLLVPMVIVLMIIVPTFADAYITKEHLGSPTQRATARLIAHLPPLVLQPHAVKQSLLAKFVVADAERSGTTEAVEVVVGILLDQICGEEILRKQGRLCLKMLVFIMFTLVLILIMPLFLVMVLLVIMTVTVIVGQGRAVTQREDRRVCCR